MKSFFFEELPKGGGCYVTGMKRVGVMVDIMQCCAVEEWNLSYT